MERLTEEKQIGQFASLKDKAEAVPGAFGTYDCLYSHMVAVTRLKAYEDTGLYPEEIGQAYSKGWQSALDVIAYAEQEGTVLVDIPLLEEYIKLGTLKHLHELAQAEKDGRLVVLPCKVGDEVYFPVEGKWDAATIDRIEIDSRGVMFGWVQYDIGPEANELWADGCFTAGDIGITVFLTREEAEAALKKREEEDNEID